MKNYHFDLIVFDLDGTLADTGPEIAICLNGVLNNWNLSAYSLPEVKGFVGNGAKVLAKRALHGRLTELQIQGEPIKEVTAEILTRFYAELMMSYQNSDNAHTVLYSGVIDFFKTAKIPSALLTNKPLIPTTRFLQHFGLDRFFTQVVAGDGVFNPKPNPAGLQHIIQKAMTTPAKTLMVGDGKPDIEVAHATGARSCALLQGFTANQELLAQKPDWAVATFSEFADLLK